MKTVAVFCEGNFETTFRKGDAEARVFADGVVEGASLFESDLFQVYVLPDDEPAMLREISDHDVGIVRREMAEADEQERLSDQEDPRIVGYPRPTN